MNSHEMGNCLLSKTSNPIRTVRNGPGRPLDEFHAAQAGFSTGSPSHLLSPCKLRTLRGVYEFF